MNNSDFVHLHVHSEHSLLDGLGSPKAYADRAAELGFLALAVTDHGNIDAHLKWQKACTVVGIKPILGCEMYLVSDMRSKEKKDFHGHVTVLVKDLAGWQALARMLTVANLEGFYYKPRLDFQTFLHNADRGLIVMTGCSSSFLMMPKGVEFLIELGKNRGIDCCLEVMPHLTDDQKRMNKLCCDLGQKYDLPLVATNDCHYVLADHTKAQEVLLAIQRQAKWSDKDRWRFLIDGLYLRTAGEMIEIFKDQGVLSRQQYYRAVINTVAVAERCWSFELPKQDVLLPLTCYEKETKVPAFNILGDLCQSRIEELRRARAWSEEYHKRFQYEMEIIKKKDFARYFLIVCEIIEWCKKQGIMVGPGRGSVGGSLVAYLLDITQVDPLRYGLLFERFISEDRIDHPDIDLDFEDIKCSLVRQHLEEEYGKYNIVGISTFLRMKGRAVIRDVGRVFNLPMSEIDLFAKSIRQDMHEEGVVKDSGETKEGKEFARRYPEEFGLMTCLEGTIRGAGQHPAGLIVSVGDLRDGKNGNICLRSDQLVCNWDMDDCEHNGLIKIDVLKLGTLTVLNEAKRLLFQRLMDTLYFFPESDCWFVDKAGGLGDLKVKEIGKFDYVSLPLNDRKIFDSLSRGETSGIFQFSGHATRDLCEKMGVDSFGDMVAIVALARPGPADSGMTDLYVRRKKGERWIPLHPAYEAITKETYGVVIYQEQMMKAMTDLAGFSNSDADRIRKVIGKKRKAEEFEPYREAFLEGCRKKKTLTEKQADEFWQGLLEWAHYGFVKAHAVEYAMIGYWACWLKLYHPMEFFCAYLTYGTESDKGEVIREAERSGLGIVTPKIGFSDARRWIARDRKLYMPFAEIKGVGEAQADKCAEMKRSAFLSGSVGRKGFFDLQEDQSNVPKNGTKIEKLLAEIKAFDPDLSARPENCLDYFQYPISEQEDVREKIAILNRRAVLDLEVKNCDTCGLRSQATQAVLSSLGMYNVLALGEAPGYDENHEGRGFVGDAGQLLWNELALYGITRRMLHVGNCCKCWPSRTKTPSKVEIDACFGKWMAPEIRSMDCRLIVAMGNIPLYALSGRDSGISSMSGQTEWIAKVRAWVVWCVHPAAVLRKRRVNIGLFQKGIEAFAETFNKTVKR
jgi:DNA polymerase-3 subunit alpha